MLLQRILDGLSTLFLIIASIAMVTLIAIFGWLVYGRYVLNATPTWVEQFAMLLIVIITFFGAAVGIRENSHLSVEFIRDIVPAPVRVLLFTISDLLLVLFGGLMAYYSFKLAMFNWTTKIPLLQLPEGLRSLPLAICGGLIVLFAGSRLILRIAGRHRDPVQLVSDNVHAE